MEVESAKDSEKPETWETTEDGMFRRRITLLQHRKGYRFSIDAVLLSAFAAEGEVGRALDLGCGCGVVVLLLADLWRRRGQEVPMQGVEVQESLASLARTNVERNGFSEQITILQRDIRTLQPTKEGWEVVTFNPPYRAGNDGQISPHPERAGARHELRGTLPALVLAGQQQLHPRGRFCLVFPVLQLPRLLSALTQAKLHLVRMRFVHPFKDVDARLVLVEVRKKQHPFVVENPLILYTGPREYSPEVQGLLDGETIGLQGTQSGGKEVGSFPSGGET